MNELEILLEHYHQLHWHECPLFPWDLMYALHLFQKDPNSETIAMVYHCLENSVYFFHYQLFPWLEGAYENSAPRF